MSVKHSFRTMPDTPIAQTVDFLKKHQELSLQLAVTQGLVLLHYPDLLAQTNAPPEEIQRALEHSMQLLQVTMTRYRYLYQKFAPQSVSSQPSVPPFLGSWQTEAPSADLEAEVEEEDATLAPFLDAPQ